MPIFRVFAACLVAALPALAQTPGRNPGGIALTHVQLNSADPDAAIAFWTDLIGTARYSRGSATGVSTLGALLLFSRNAPSGPSAGSAIDHIAFHVPDLQTFVDKLAKTPYKSFRPAGSQDVLMIDGPDGVRIELIEDNSMYAPLEFSHIHLYTKAPKETQSWYATSFGARAGTDDQANTSRMAGGALTFSSADSVAPSAGRAIDHISFQVGDVQSLCNKLSATGVKFDAPIEAGEMAKGGSVFLTDPWGTRIELTGANAQ